MKRLLIKIAKPVVEHFPNLAASYRSVRDGWQTGVVPGDTALGFRFSGNQSMQDGEFEVEETRLVRKLLPHADAVINIGANIGYYCCIALSGGKQVVAFEPISRNLQCLLRNIKANDWSDEIEVFPLALSDKAGVIEIYGGGTMASLVKGWSGVSEQYVTLVPASTLDQVLGTRFSGRRCLLLVDIEGAELPMLKGALSFVELNPKPIWLMEISTHEHQPEGVNINPNLLATFQVFWSRGYEAWTADSKCRLVLHDELENIIRTGQDTLLTHNFLFIEQGRKRELLDS